MADPKRYAVLARPVDVEEVIRKSRFITSLRRVETKAEARQALEAIREANPGATHYCVARVLGPPGSTAGAALSDDGEPHGTAGQPMLRVLLHSDVGDVMAVVTRFYGGTKLGRGGLVRAYSGGVQQALAEAELTEKVARRELRISLGYAGLEPLRRLCGDWEAEIEAEQFGAAIELTVVLPEEHVTAFLEQARTGVDRDLKILSRQQESTGADP